MHRVTEIGKVTTMVRVMATVVGMVVKEERPSCASSWRCRLARASFRVIALKAVVERAMAAERRKGQVWLLGMLAPR